MDSQPSTPQPKTVLAHGQEIVGPRPSHFMNTDSRHGFAIALQRAERWLEFSYRDGRPDTKRLTARALVIAACHRQQPTKVRQLLPIAEFWMN